MSKTSLTAFRYVHNISPALDLTEFTGKVNRAWYACIIFFILWYSARYEFRDRKIAGKRNNTEPVPTFQTGNASSSGSGTSRKNELFYSGLSGVRYRPRCVHALFPLSEIEFIEISMLTRYIEIGTTIVIKRVAAV